MCGWVGERVCVCVRVCGWVGVWVGVLCVCVCVRVHMSLNVGVGECVSLDRSPCRPDQVSEGITLLIDAQSSKTHIPAKMLIESLAVSPSHPHTLTLSLPSSPPILCRPFPLLPPSLTPSPIPSHLKSPTPLPSYRQRVLPSLCTWSMFS